MCAFVDVSIFIKTVITHECVLIYARGKNFTEIVISRIGLQIVHYVYRNKARLRTRKKTTLLLNDGGRERQKEYPTVKNFECVIFVYKYFRIPAGHPKV